jgi:acid phosphatase class B
MTLTGEALGKVQKWLKSGISKYRIAQELSVKWITVWRWEKKKSKPSVSVSKNILDTEIEK